MEWCFKAKRAAVLLDVYFVHTNPSERRCSLHPWGLLGSEWQPLGKSDLHFSRILLRFIEISSARASSTLIAMAQWRQKLQNGVSGMTDMGQGHNVDDKHWGISLRRNDRFAFGITLAIGLVLEKCSYSRFSLYQAQPEQMLCQLFSNQFSYMYSISARNWHNQHISSPWAVIQKTHS